jgi:hypothetical protein
MIHWAWLTGAFCVGGFLGFFTAAFWALCAAAKRGDERIPNMYKLRERLAEYAHEAWSGWMRYMFKKAVPGKGNTWEIQKPEAERWIRQMWQPYDQLPENEKESDRKEADRMLAICAEAQPMVYGSQPVSLCTPAERKLIEAAVNYHYMGSGPDQIRFNLAQSAVLAERRKP